MTTISKTHTLQDDVTVNYQFILAETEPATPTGYERATDLDVDLGSVGKVWAYIQVA